MSAANAAKILAPMTSGDLAEKVGVIPMVELPGDDVRLLDFVLAMSAHLVGAGLYRRCGEMVLPNLEERRLSTMTPEAFCSWSQDYVCTVRKRHDSNGEPFMVMDDMTTDLSKKVLVSPAFSAAKEIAEVRQVPVPVRAATGAVELAGPGFSDGIFTFPFEGGYADMSLQEGVSFIRGLLREFPFEGVREVSLSDEDGGDGSVVRQCRSQAVQVAAMLSQFCVGLIPESASRMGFVFDANSQRSGKTLLAKLAIMPNSNSFRGQSWKSNDEELKKLIDAEMRQGANYICFDNVRGKLSSQTIEGMMTSPEYTGRVLGKTEMFLAKNRASLFFTGNGSFLSPDMAHRCLVCRLFVPEGDVQERKVENLIDEPWLANLENRRAILSSLWAIVRAWHEAGEPKASSLGFKPRLGFESWGEIIGGIVGFAGFGDPLEKEVVCDMEMRDVLLLVAAMVRGALGEHAGEFTPGEMVDLCHDEGLFEWMMDGRLVEGSFKLTAKARSSFGLMLGRYAPNGSSRTYKVGENVVRFGQKGAGKLKRYFVEF